jgi:Mrp family chromosome partitioning ATPase
MQEATTMGKDAQVKHRIAVMSAKGGVGKSVVTGVLAAALQRQGHRVGILDGNLWCPSIAQIFNLENETPMYTEEGFEPPLSKSGIKVISMNMSEDKSEPLVWHGPMISSALEQFYNQVLWGELDYLLIDVAPGMSDVPITVLKSFPLDGVIIVSTPQSTVTAIVKKCIDMVRQHQRRVIGVVENMAYFLTPTGKHNEPYGPSSSAELAALAGVTVLAQLPIDTNLTALCDEGRVEDYNTEASETLARNFLQAFDDLMR